MLTKWFEVWVDDSMSTPYILIVTLDSQNPSSIIVLDPIKGFELAHQGYSYESVKLWLLEDEYRLVAGRMEVE
jgi:hypothetical protein